MNGAGAAASSAHVEFAMIRRSLTALAVPLLLGLAAFRAEAADTVDTSDVALVNNADVVIELGAGGRLQPEYEGASDYEVSPFPIISLEYLNVPGLVEIGERDGAGDGFSIGPSFSYVGERDPDDHPELLGLDTVDATYQLGVRIGYESTYGEVYGKARYAFGGADGFVGEVGANAIARPIDTVELKVGPRLSFASADYMDAYFGVSAAESAASVSGLAPFDPDGGIKSAGVAATARYEFQPNWFLNADASWDRLVGDAGDSPIVDVGDENQYTFGLGLSRRFTLDLF